MYSPAERVQALELLRSGLNLSEVSKRTGVSRAALRAWRNDPTGTTRRKGETCLRCHGYRFPAPGASSIAYAHLLGLYLGDGHISAHPRSVYRLRLFMDRRYPLVVNECEASIAIAMPASRVGVVSSRASRMDVVYSFSKHWPCLFPQHGPGMKHERPIVLEPWQREIVDRHPWRFLRGLIQSDGCRSINAIRHPKRTYAYPRYEFSNRSDDIRALFCEYCDRVGVEWRRMNRWTISVARSDSVALMDRSIGPKR